MNTVWAQRREELLSDCIVSPDVFNHMMDRLGDFVVPYQHALEAEAGGRHVHRDLQGLLSHVDRKNAEAIAALVNVERQVIQDFIGTAPWDHRPDTVGEPRILVFIVLIRNSGQERRGEDPLPEREALTSCHISEDRLFLRIYYIKYSCSKKYI